MRNQSAQQLHRQVAFTDWQNYQELKRKGRMEIDGACLNKSTVLAVAR